MDITRVDDPAYIAELQRAQRVRDDDTRYVADRIDVLELVAKGWTDGRSLAGQQLPNISIHESVALKLALHREAEFQYPVAQFILLAPWQQAWVLTKWRMDGYIGRKLGVAE